MKELAEAYDRAQELAKNHWSVVMEKQPGDKLMSKRLKRYVAALRLCRIIQSKIKRSLK